MDEHLRRLTRDLVEFRAVLSLDNVDAENLWEREEEYKEYEEMGGGGRRRRNEEE